MAFACRLYKSTGFNTVNVPDKPSLLDSFSYDDTDVIDVISTYNNNVVRVKLAQAPDWQYYDYLRLGSGSNIANRAYYAITGFRFTSPDVIEFSVVQDTWLTLGGLDGFTNGEINILSGTTNRHHIPKAEDKYSDYNEEDEMLIPSDPVRVLKKQHIGGNLASEEMPSGELNNVTLIKTSVDLNELGTQLPSVINFPTQSMSGDVTGQIPSPADFCYPKLVGSYSKVGLFSGKIKGFNIDSGGFAKPIFHGTMGQDVANADTEFTLPNEVIFVAGNATERFRNLSGTVGNVNQGLARARGMGYDTAITASYSLPQNAISGYVDNVGNGGIGLMVGMTFINARKAYNDVWTNGAPTWTGSGILEEQFEFEYCARNGQGSSINNLRAIKGEYFKYELISPASGQRTEFLGEDIVKASADLHAAGTVYKPDETATARSAPILMTICDPRPDGCPYFTYYDERNFINMYNNSIKGLKWTEAPIRYDVKSGLAVDNLRSVKNTQQRDIRAKIDAAIIEGQTVKSDATSLFGAAGNLVTGNWQGAANNLVNPIQHLYGMGESNLVDRAVYGDSPTAQAQLSRYIDRQREQAEFRINAAVQVPEISFPMNDSIKEAVGNGAILVRYALTDNDIAKFDKILNMYGYKHTAAIDESMFDNRSKYNYIEAAGVTFGGTAAKFLRDDLANMFSSGVRIWHVAPDPALYVGTSNS